MTDHVLTFPIRAWARIENRAERFELDGAGYISSAIKLGSLIVERYWQNSELGQNTVICLHDEEDDKTHLVYHVEDDLRFAAKSIPKDASEISESGTEGSTDDSGIDADDFLESEILLNEALPSLVQVPFNGDDLESTLFFSAALETQMVDFISWCIRMRCHYDISEANGFAMIVNDASNNTVTQIHLS